MRRLGYSPSRKGDSFIRRAGSGEFPRFHIYIDDHGDKWQCKIHLDQKGACYTNHTAHSGDYDGDVLQIEKERITNLLR
jgi:hypothetical protein